MKKLVACASILFLSACSSSNSIRGYLPDINWSNLDPIGQGTLKAYEGNILTIRNQCDSITDTLNSKPLSKVLNSNRDRQTLLRNAANLNYMRIRQDIYLTQDWLDYVNQDLNRYKNLANQFEVTLGSDTLIELENFKDVAMSAINLCRGRKNKIEAVVAGQYLSEAERESFSNVLHVWIDDNRQIYRNFITKENVSQHEKEVQKFSVEGDTAYVQYGKASFPVYVGSKPLSLKVASNMTATLDEGDPRTVIVEEDFSNLPL